MYNLENQLLNIYMEDMDNIIDEAFDETIIFESMILEAEADAPAAGNNANATNNDTVADKAKAIAKDASGKIKEMLRKLGELLDKFINALQRIGDIIKTKVGNLVKNIEIFKRGANVKTEFSVIKFDAAYNNAIEINKISKDMNEEVIKPIGNNQDPKNNSIDDYMNRFKAVSYNTFIEDKNNQTNYKPGNTIASGILQGNVGKGDDIIKIHAEGFVRTKATRVIEKNLENKTGSEENDSLKLFYKAASSNIKMNQDINRYFTKYIGDMSAILKNSEPIKAG